MKLFNSGKLRLTTLFLLILLFALFVVVGFSYYLLAKSVYSNEGSPDMVYTTEIDIPDYNATSNMEQDIYENLISYTLSEDRLSEIQNGASGTMRIGTSIGILQIDQSKFITAETHGAQKVWIYYRASPSNPEKIELMMFVRPMDETHQVLGQFANVVIIALPVVIVLAFVIFFLLIKRLFLPLESIKNIAQKINNGDTLNHFETSGSTEFGELGTILNQAFGRMGEALEGQQHLIAETSHELRAPLTVMQGEATLALRKERTTPEYEDCLKILVQEISYLSSIVNNLMIAAKIDSNQDRPNLIEVDMTGLINRLSSSFKTLCEGRGLTFSLSVENNIKIHGDEAKLKEVFYNLIENAVKYNRAGGQVSLSLKHENGYAVIRVSDTGIGIKAEHITRIFDRYYRIEESSSQNQAGSGLGLYICKRIVELHNGRIEVESEFGKGSTFIVYLPLLMK